MKKALLMFLVVFGLVTAFWIGASMSQDRVRKIVKQPNANFIIRNQGKSNLIFIDSADEVTPEQLRLLKLRQEFLELMKGHAGSMTEKELSEAIAHLKSLRKEAEAKKKFNQAVALLEEIVKQHPNSKTGRQARIMLRFLNTQGGDAEDAGDAAATPNDPPKVSAPPKADPGGIQPR